MYKKYPRTFHIPSSQGISSDDKVLKSLDIFDDRNVIITEKMDGENSSLYNNHYHARSIDSRHHDSRSWLKLYYSSFRHNIPESYRICGENLYAKHSISYNNLLSYFYGFSVWNDDVCLSWDETIEWFKLLDIVSVPVLYIGKFDMNIVRELENYVIKNRNIIEGFVIRNVGEFNISEFQNNVGKFVRNKHVTSDSHWMHSETIPNKLALQGI